MPSKQILNRIRPHGDSEVFPCNFADFADLEDFNWPNYIFLSLDPSITAYSGDAGDANCVGKFCVPIWLSLDPSGCPWRSDFGDTGLGLIWAKLKSEFTTKNFRLQMTTALGRSSRIKTILWKEF